MLVFPLALLATGAYAQSSGQSTESATSTAPPSPSSVSEAASSSAAAVTSVSFTPVTTATPTAATTATQTIGGKGALPPQQTWCPSSIFCSGPLLQALNLALPYTDPKTIVDKPTNKSSEEVLADFQKLVEGVGGLNNISQLSVGSIVNLLETDFRGEGQELAPDDLPEFVAEPPFLKNITDPLIKGFAQVVNNVWPSLIRKTNESSLCASQGNSSTCESSLIPLNHTFVVPGGRFREQYYWDSYWILEGLFESGLYSTANSTLQNFMDELDTIGFIPNGGRIYYLDRSQPPLFIRMLYNYVVRTGDKSILERGLPLAEKELRWWDANRAINVTSSYSGQTYKVYRFAVVNSAPRPESYLQDYTTTNGEDVPEGTYNQTQREELWAELATGAETGWDYTSRFMKEPLLNTTNNYPALRTLNIRQHVPVDLNSILYGAHQNMAKLYGIQGGNNENKIRAHYAAAGSLKAAILDLTWDPKTLGFYDYNMTADARNKQLTIATYYPAWVNIIPDEVLKNETAAQGYFGSVNLVLSRYNGTYPTTFLDSGLQWDLPNAWPPHNYIVLAALQAMPKNISSAPLPKYESGSFAALPEGQLGITEAELTPQPIDVGGNINATGADADVNFGSGTWTNGGNTIEGEGWRDALSRGLANRYVGSALCSFQASGGSVPGLLPQVPADQRIEGAEELSGLFFEKYSAYDLDSGGRGGEYTVQAGFGWTNGVILWSSSKFGKVLSAPTCPKVHKTSSDSSGNGDGKGGDNGASSHTASPSKALTTAGFLGLSLLTSLFVL